MQNAEAYIGYKYMYRIDVCMYVYRIEVLDMHIFMR